MNIVRCVISSSLLLVLLTLHGLAQSSSITGTITTYAGPPLPVSGTQATRQDIGSPRSVVADGAGGFYVATSGQHRIYRVAGDGTLTVIAGTGLSGFKGDGGPAIAAELYNPTGITLDQLGNLLIADTSNHRIRMVTPNGIISTVAGSGTLGFGGDGTRATAAQLNNPSGVAVDRSGNLFIADTYNNRIRKVTSNSVISTIGGTGTSGFSGDSGSATLAKLALPTGVAVDDLGNVFIADTANHRIRRISSIGFISTVAGTGNLGFGGDGGPAISALLTNPQDVAVDSAGNLFIADTGGYYGGSPPGNIGGNSIRKVTPNGVINTVAGGGDGGYGFNGDEARRATSALLSNPEGVAVDGSGNLFIADSGNQRVRKVTVDGFIRTVAGIWAAGFGGDGGPATAAQLTYPTDIAAARSGNLFIADSGNHRIRKVTPDGVISTIAGDGMSRFGGDNGPAAAASLSFPSAVAVDESGNLFIADNYNCRIRKITPDGVISTVAGNGTAGFSGDGGPATAAQLAFPSGVAVDRLGNLFIADAANHRIRKVTADGTINTIAGDGTASFRVDNGPATAAELYGPSRLAVDEWGNLYIADTYNYRIRKVNADGIISTVAGTGTNGFSGDGGPANAAKLGSPWAVAVDAAGNLFIAENGGSRIRKVTPDGLITTVAGNGIAGFSGDGALATGAEIAYPSGVAVDTAGNLFIADTSNTRIRKVTFTQRVPYSVSDRGGDSSVSSGTLPSTVVGYASIQPNIGAATPAGLAIFGLRQNNILVTEASVPASPLIRSGRIYVEINAFVNTGLAIANPNNQPATVSFEFTVAGDADIFGRGSTTIPANGQIAKFLSESPFNAPSLSGTFTFRSSVPIAVIALRGLTNERGEFLITTLPVADLNTPATTGTITIPHFADGGGWMTQIVLVNPGDTPLTGTVQFLDQSGSAATVALNIDTSFGYSVSSRASLKLQTSGAGAATMSGSVRLVPAPNSIAPSALVISSFRDSGTTVTEAGVPAVEAGTAFRLYAEASASVKTGIAVVNTSGNAATVTLELSKLDGSSTGLIGSLVIPANGQKAIFLNEVQGFGSLQMPFQGVLRLSSPSPIAVTGLRGHYNERNDFLITTTPAVNEAATPSPPPLFFPHIVDSGGYTTQFILFSVQPGAPSPGTMQLFNRAGGALGLTLR